MAATTAVRSVGTVEKVSEKSAGFGQRESCEERTRELRNRDSGNNPERGREVWRS